MWTLNENNNAKSKASRRERDRNCIDVYNKTILTLSSDDDDETDIFNPLYNMPPELNDPQVFPPHIDEPNMFLRHIAEPNIFLPHIDEPNIVLRHIDEPNIVLRHIDEPNIFLPHIDEPNIVLPHIDEPNIVLPERMEEDSYSVTNSSSSVSEIDFEETDSEFEFDLDEFIESTDSYEKMIYKHSEIKLKHFITIFTAAFTGLKISKMILNKFLKFLRAILPQDELNIPKTLDSMNKFYEISKIQTLKVCSKCSDTLSNESICEKHECLRFQNAKKNKNKLDPILTEFEFTNELKLLLEKNWPTIVEYRTTLSRNLVSDIFNSAHYTSKQLAINNISLCLFIDGAQFNKSNNGTIWAILGIVTNLPPLIRSAFNNLIKILFIHGTLFDFNGIFAKHLTKLKSLLANGLTIMVSNCETKITINIHALIADNPGRAKICYCRQHNGRYGCFHCLSQCYTTDGEK